jgi:hypothetical protein
MSKPLTNDSILIRLVLAKRPLKEIAAKLSISEAEVERRWHALQQEIAGEMATNGHGDIIVQWTTLCMQYQLLGESLKALGSGLCNLAHVSDLMEQVPGLRDVQAIELVRKFIILRPYVAVDPAQAIEKQLEGN